MTKTSKAEKNRHILDFDFCFSSAFNDALTERVKRENPPETRPLSPEDIKRIRKLIERVTKCRI